MGGKPLTDRVTHRARILAHEVFDELWKSGKMTRTTAYARLADVMEMAPRDCHISLMGAGDAGKVRRMVQIGRLDADMRSAPITEGSPRDRKQKLRGEVWITVGADCPWNTTPGIRQVHHFQNVAAAHRAGFTSVR